MLSTHLFNPNPIDFTKSSLFLDKSGRNISRLDLSVEQNLSNMTATALGQIWFSDDFSYSKDAGDYQNMDPLLRELFLKNLKFQTLLDSLAARTVAEVFIPIATSPQVESWLYQHAFFENNIHSLTYADVLKAMPVDATAIFDDIMVNDNILNRAQSIISCFEDTVVWNARMVLDVDYDRPAHMRSIVLSLYALNILEAVLFKSSFLVTFAFKENGMMSTVADAIIKIQLDEMLHMAFTNNMLNRLRKDPEWASAVQSVETQAYSLYTTAIEADHQWIDHLFENNTKLFGINSSVMKQYVDNNLANVMKSIGLTPFTTDTFNPCLWATKYTKPSVMQVAQKEKTSGLYLLGITDTAMTDKEWSNL